MSAFIVSYIIMIATVLFLVPLVYRSIKTNVVMRSQLQSIRRDFAETTSELEYFRRACQQAPDGILVQDMQSRILWANDAYARIHDTPIEDLIGRSPLEHALPRDKSLSQDEISNFRYDPNDPKWDTFELVENQRPDGTMFWNQITLSFVKTADGSENAILMCRDVTKQVKQQADYQQIAEQLEHEASHDAMTDVANRSAFLKFIRNALGATDREPVGLLHIDLDNFKDTNDTHGHSAGDAVLIHTARIIRENIRDCDLVARVGGDEFVVVCPQTNNLDDLNGFSKSILAAISEPFNWNDRIFQIAASIGAALSQSQTTTAEDLLVQSDFALYEAKRAGRDQVALYNEDLHERHSRQNRRAADLSKAVNDGDLIYYFQPKMSLTTGEITGFETLVRWDHPTEGLIQPDEFLTTVKDLGLLGIMDLWSMTTAIKQKRMLNQSGYDHIGVAFNASPELLRHPDFINRLVWGVEASGIRRDQVTIEVLETTNFGNVSEMTSHAATIRDLRVAGFQVHLDDFGVGFAGLSHLAHLDVSGVKIDRGLIANLMTDNVSHKIVRKIVELSNDLDLTVIAEGVEDHDTANALRHMGCGAAQGFWLAKPIPCDHLIQWLQDRREIAARLRA